MSRLRTVLIEPNTLLREGLAHLISATLPLSIQAFSNAEDFLRKIKTDSAVSLLLLSAPNLHIAAGSASQIRRTVEVSKVVAFAEAADHYEGNNLQELDGCVLRSASAEVLSKTLELVLLGQRVLPQPGTLPADTSDDLKPDNRLRAKMSPREIQILHCLMTGDSNKIIARRFVITESTVKVHVKAILRKTAARNRTEAAMWGASHRSLIGLDTPDSLKPFASEYATASLST